MWFTPTHSVRVNRRELLHTCAYMAYFLTDVSNEFRSVLSVNRSPFGSCLGKLCDDAFSLVNMNCGQDTGDFHGIYD